MAREALGAGSMGGIRAIARGHMWLALVLLMATLAVRALVPAGMMLDG